METEENNIKNILKIKTELKKPKFHSTFSDFDKFDISKSPFGIHFGSKESALNRVEVKIEEAIRTIGNSREDAIRIGIPLPDKGENPFLLELEVDIKNPLILSENRLGAWKASDVFMTIMEQHAENPIKGITEDEYEGYECDEFEFNGILFVDLFDEEYKGEYLNQELKEQLYIADWIKSKGFDSIMYENEFEHGGSSFIVFDVDKITIKNKTQLNPDFDKNKNKNKNKLKHC